MTIRDVVSTINHFHDVSATLDPATGKLRIASRVLGGSLAIGDTSGLLSTLGIQTGKVEGTRGVRRLETELPQITTSNAGTVAANVSAAADKLNAVLSQLDSVAGSNPGVVNQTVSTLAHAMESLGEEIAQGLSLGHQGTVLRIDVDTDKLEQSLNDNASALVVTMEGRVGDFLQETRKFGTAVESQPANQTISASGLGNRMFQFATGQLSNLMMLLQPASQLLKPIGFFKAAADAYDQQKNSKNGG
jgi:hypothetical protein